MALYTGVRAANDMYHTSPADVYNYVSDKATDLANTSPADVVDAVTGVFGSIMNSIATTTTTR